MKTKETEVLETNVASGLVDRRPGDLKPWPGNPRTHNDKQLAKLKASIQKFGFTAPVVRKNSVRESKSLKNRAFERIQSQGE